MPTGYHLVPCCGGYDKEGIDILFKRSNLEGGASNWK